MVQSHSFAPRAVTLDLWHTLVYLAPESEERYMRSQLDIAETALKESEIVKRPIADDAPPLREVFGQELAEAVAASQRGVSVTPAQQFEKAARRAGRRPSTPTYVRELTALVGRTGFRKAPGALGVLRRLRARGFRTAVISNTTGEPGAALRPVLGRLGFDGLIDQLVFSDEQPWTKPSPKIFAYTLRQLGVAPTEAVHVGDGWVDVEGAKRAGFRGGILFTGLQTYGEQYRKLFLPPDWTSPPTPYRTRRLSEVPELVETIFR